MNYFNDLNVFSFIFGPCGWRSLLTATISAKNYISPFNNRQVNQLQRRLWEPVSTANRKIPTSIKHRTPNVLPELYSHTTWLRRAFKIQNLSNLKALLRIRNSDHRASKYIRWVLSHVEGRPNRSSRYVPPMRPAPLPRSAFLCSHYCVTAPQWICRVDIFGISVLWIITNISCYREFKMKDAAARLLHRQVEGSLPCIPD